MVNDKEESIKSGLEQARRDYAAEKERAISSQMQELSVAKFEIDYLPDQREVGEILRPFFARTLKRRHFYSVIRLGKGFCLTFGCSLHVRHTGAVILRIPPPSSLDKFVDHLADTVLCR